jgi:hypothetical protein
MSVSAAAAPFNVSYVSPSVATVAATSVITFRGVALDQIKFVRYRSSHRLRSVNVLTQTATQITASPPCTRHELGAGLFSVSLTPRGDASNIEHAGSSGAGLRVVCMIEPRHDGMRPFAGPSWPGLRVKLTTTRHDPTACDRQLATAKFVCNPPPVDVADQTLLLAGT